MRSKRSEIVAIGLSVGLYVINVIILIHFLDFRNDAENRLIEYATAMDRRLVVERRVEANNIEEIEAEILSSVKKFLNKDKVRCSVDGREAGKNEAILKCSVP